jgi:hypothetical protein
MVVDGFWHRVGRAAPAAFLAFCLAVAVTCCGKKEGPSSKVPPQAGQAGGSAESSTAAPAGGREETSVSAGGGFTVHIAPSSPSRITPPSVSVKSPPGLGADVLGVKWLINGEERESGQILPPSAFRRGDRLQAIVKLRAGGEEKHLSTPEVAAVNAMPAVVDVRIEPQAPTSGSTVRAVVQAQDPDADPLTLKYRWYVDDVPVPGDIDSIPLKGVKKGSRVHVAVTPNDGISDGAWRYSPRYQVVNGPPVVKSEPPKTIPPSRVLTHTVIAEDPDGDPMTYTLVKGPEGITLSGATLTWKVSDRDLEKPAEIVIRISDDDGASTVLTMILNPRKP